MKTISLYKAAFTVSYLCIFVSAIIAIFRKCHGKCVDRGPRKKPLCGVAESPACAGENRVDLDAVFPVGIRPSDDIGYQAKALNMLYAPAGLNPEKKRYAATLDVDAIAEQSMACTRELDRRISEFKEKQDTLSRVRDLTREILGEAKND